MLIRIVRMTFRENEVAAFLALFNESKEQIRNFPGCHHLTLLEDYHDSNVFSTYSIWDDDEALNQYRKSALFAKVWKATKAKFAAPPLAFSNRELIKVE